MARNTDDLRDAGGMATTVKMFTGSVHVPRTLTTARPPAAVDSAGATLAADRREGRLAVCIAASLLVPMGYHALAGFYR